VRETMDNSDGILVSIGRGEEMGGRGEGVGEEEAGQADMGLPIPRKRGHRELEEKEGREGREGMDGMQGGIYCQPSGSQSLMVSLS
jgi:hypothetical protein